MKDQIKKLNDLNACRSAMDWVKDQKDPQQAWDSCARGDWMLWLLGKLSGDSSSDSRKQLVVIACECARLSLKHVPENEQRPLKAIEAAEAWTRGEATLEEVKKAADDADSARAAAYAARAAAYAAAYAAAAYAAAAAAADAAAAAYAAAADAAAAYAARAAYAADAAYAAAAARSSVLKQCADIAREHHPEVPKL